VELSGENHRQLYVPPGFAHGFCICSETADFMYKCTDFYAPQYEHGILWNDPDIGIDWPGGDFLISEKDANNSLLKAMEDRLPVYKE
jgi:dTDP-4-dehydrorhamnose 3,5-epimerase